MVSDYEADVARLEDELKVALVERDPADDKDVIIEIRGGEAGMRASSAGDLAKVLQRYAERRGYRWRRSRRLRAMPAASRRNVCY